MSHVPLTRNPRLKSSFSLQTSSLLMACHVSSRETFSTPEMELPLHYVLLGLILFCVFLFAMGLLGNIFSELQCWELIPTDVTCSAHFGASHFTSKKQAVQAVSFAVS